MKNRFATLAFSALVAVSAAALALPALAAEPTPAKDAGTVHNPPPKHHPKHTKKHTTSTTHTGSASGTAAPSTTK